MLKELLIRLWRTLRAMVRRQPPTLTFMLYREGPDGATVLRVVDAPTAGELPAVPNGGRIVIEPPPSATRILKL